MPMSLVSESLAMSTSYLASILVARKPHRMDCWTKSPSGKVRTEPMPKPFILLEPTTESIHLDVQHSIILSNFLLTYTSVVRVKSAMKSAGTYDLSAVQCWKVMT